MGRPLNNKYFKGGFSDPIKVSAKFPSGDVKDAIIDRQVGSTKFMVSNGANVARCDLVDKDPSDLQMGEMLMPATDSNNNIVNIIKITSHRAILSDSTGHSWGFDDAVGDSLKLETFVDGDNVTTPSVETNIPLNPEVTNSSGNLLVGNGNPSNNMVQSSNTELEIACRIGLYNQSTILPLSGTTYTVDTGGNKDWNFSFSFYLADNPLGKALTDLYDISIHIWSTPHIDLTMSLVMDNTGLYHLQSNDGTTINIIDGVTNDIKSVYQNIQRLTPVAAALGQPVNSVGAALGTIHIDYTATRKTGDFDPVVLNVIVNAS